ncbi:MULTISPECIES: TetR/AcrR family transcriptional regulator [unclassified Microbacterium]|uniref:TetR/AcrR family transcriptional regulator n=1 Tax=unclassified Microbacterium TaxID=2609290 RepID=UPI000EAAB9BF|nr:MULTISPECIES: TetR/AcrR family transcriptional regulator [unclassified Microbacterium]MBT2486878.1 TetR/AcrR family transcriptional regulator [Microbacterium sp. ISL-108]RKN64797.1 TetR/AcrR family transcriptional regulator [Microbacterium sp. CGR2]
MPDDDDLPRQRGAYAKGIARRQEILDRAIEVFAERGSDRTSLRAIAREVGVTHAALTHYFGSLEELLVAVYAESNAPAHRAETQLRDATPVEQMIESARTNREVPGLVQLYSMLVASALEEGHPVAREFATTRFARLRADIAASVKEQQDRGRIRADAEPDAVAALVVAASDGLQTQWLLDDAAPQHEALALLDRLLRPPG